MYLQLSTEKTFSLRSTSQEGLVRPTVCVPERAGLARGLIAGSRRGCTSLSSVIHVRPSFATRRGLRSNVQLFICSYAMKKLQRAVAQADLCRGRACPSPRRGISRRTRLQGLYNAANTILSK